MSEGLEVYKAIVAVQGDLAKEGIAKDKTCTQGASYKFRGIDDVYNALSPFLSKHNLCVLPRMLSRECVERESKSGNALFYVTVSAEFDFVSAVDGSKHTVGPMYGEAMDSGDKGTNKAMSAAYKYAAFQAFCIPTEGDNDADASAHEVKHQPPKPAAQAPTAEPKDAEYQGRVRMALQAIYGDDIAQKKAKIKELTTFAGKDGKEVTGIEDYRTLKGKRLEILCHKLEAMVPKKEAALCVDTPFRSIE